MLKRLRKNRAGLVPGWARYCRFGHPYTRPYGRYAGLAGWNGISDRCWNTGPYDSVIGVQKEQVLQRFLTGLPGRFEAAKVIRVSVRY